MVDEVNTGMAKIKLPYRYEIEIEGKHLIYREYFKKDEKLNVDVSVTMLNRMLELMKGQGMVEDYRVSVEEGDEIMVMLDIEYSDERHLYDGLIAEFLPKSGIGNMTLMDMIVRRSLEFSLSYLAGGEKQ